MNMPIIVFLYDSITGATELLIKAVIEGLGNLDDIELRLLKLGSKFSISAFQHIDALVVGSPSIYGDMTPPLRAFLTNLREFTERHKLTLNGVKGAAVGSYAWDGGWHLERMEAMLLSLGVEMVAYPLAIADRGGKMRIHPYDIERCRELGRAIRVSVA